MSEITLIQFHNHTEDSDDRSPRNMKGRWFILESVNDVYEFYNGEDDNGDPTYDEKYCVSYYDDFNDFMNEENLGYMVKRGLKYSLFTFEIDYDKNTKTINWGG